MEKTWKPMVAGILNIVSGVLELFCFIALVIGGFVTSNPLIFEGNVPPVNVPAICFGLAVLCLVIGVLILIGGFSALQRKRWGWALTGSILAIFSAFILGILATVFTAQSKNEFE